MKPRLIAILGVGFALIGVACFVACLGLFRGHAVSVFALEHITDTLSKADSVEIIDLVDKPKSDSKRIVTAESKGEYFTSERKILSTSASKALITLLQEHYYTTESRAGCHDPGELLIFRKGNQKLLEFTLCLKCTNIEFYPYPFLGSVVMLFDSKPSSVELDRLKTFLKNQKNEANK